MRRFLLFPVALLAVSGMLLVGTTRSVSAAPADAPQRTCINDWNNQQEIKGSAKADKMIKDFNKTSCPVSKGGKCSVSTYPQGDKKYSRITCTPLEAAGGTDAPTGGSTACNGATICLSGLPHTGADESLISSILRIVIGITAAVSVLFIAIGGVRYIISQGEPQAVTRAKSTIVYALIGLVVAIIAQAIVTFVINGVSS